MGEPRTELRWAVQPAVIGAALGLGGFLLFSPAATPAVSPPKEAFAAPVDSAPPFAGCAEARAAGRTPIYRGEPGYAPWLDGDDDGIGCERW